jgi:hypothetical protein
MRLARLSSLGIVLWAATASNLAFAAEGDGRSEPERRCAAAAEPGSNPEHIALVRWSLGPGCSFFEVPITFRGSIQTAGSVPVDRYGNDFRSKLSLAPVIRIGARLSSGLALRPVQLHAEYEQDLLTGAESSTTDLAGDGYPGAEGLHVEPRKAFVRGSIGRALHLTTGLDTSHWGLGLVANDGDHDWQPGSAGFVFPQGGDRVFRWSAGTGPHTDLGIAATLGADQVYRDDVLLPGDRARQFFAAALVGAGKPHSFGVYVVRRNQKDSTQRATDVWVVDAAARSNMALDAGKLSLAAESALITGKTALGPSTDFASHDVRQLGAALRAAFDAVVVGGVLDVLYASGDQNPYDGQQNAFRSDPNYEMGLVLFRYVLAAQSARAAATAGDPTLVGVRPDNLERIPTRGSATNTLAFFPRVFVRPLKGLEAYGGPLFAFTPVDNIDLFNTRLAGGAPRNALNGRPGSYLGTELDAGARYRITSEHSELTFGAEGGTLLAGSALRDAAGDTMKSVYVVRGVVRLGL